MPGEVRFEDALGRCPSHLLTAARWEVGCSQADQAPPIAGLPRLPVTPCTPTVFLFYHHCDQTPNDPNCRKLVPGESSVAGGSWPVTPRPQSGRQGETLALSSSSLF